MIRFMWNGLVLRSILVTLVAFFLAGIVSIGYIAYETGERATRTTSTRLEQLLDTVQSTLRIACFLNDNDLAKEVALGLLSNPEVQRVMIRGENDMLADVGRHDLSHGAHADELALEREITSPFNPKGVVGRVRLSPNPDVIEKLRKDDMLLAVKQLAWLLFIVSGAIISALVILIVRPISRMSLALHKMDPAAGDRLWVPPGHDHTEIGRLVQDVNELSDSLVAALDEAREARAEAEAASLAKSSFLASMSHEIRTPLNAIFGLVRIGLKETRGRQTSETYERILASSEHLLEVINDILDFSKIEAGKLEIEFQPLRLGDIVRQVQELLAGRAAEKGLVLEAHESPDLPAWVAGDAVRIRQILINLLSNAIKFTASGKVVLIVTRVENEVWFEVRDEGIGMTPDEVSRLFRPFEQADSSTTRKYGGTGLGLAISMNLASLMGGGIQVISTPGQGSTFTLHLPLAATATPAEAGETTDQAAACSGLPGLRVLAAEDIEMNRLILEDMLLEAGATCSFAVNGREAVDRVTASPEGFDVVLMDVQMPEMDGHEAARRIHAMAPGLPIIGLTAHAFKGERDRCLAAGMVDHLGKPVCYDQLVATIRHWVAPRAAATDAVPAGVAAEGLSSPPEQDALPACTCQIDWDQLRRRYQDKDDFIRRICRSVLDSQADAPARLRSLAVAGDTEELARLAHTLKGVSGNLVANDCQDAAAMLETAAKTGEADLLPKAETLAVGMGVLLGELRQHLAPCE